MSGMSVLLLFLLRDSFAEDRPREYREGAYCKDISYVDTSTEGVEGTLECQAGASSGLCIRHAECIKKDGQGEERSGCQSLYVRDALDDNKGIYDVLKPEGARRRRRRAKPTVVFGANTNVETAWMIDCR